MTDKENILDKIVNIAKNIKSGESLEGAVASEMTKITDDEFGGDKHKTLEEFNRQLDEELDKTEVYDDADLFVKVFKEQDHPVFKDIPRALTIGFVGDDGTWHKLHIKHCKGRKDVLDLGFSK